MSILLFTINPGLEIVGLLPVGIIGEAYTVTLTVRGGLEPYQIAVISTLPDGLTATDNGDGTLTIAGTPTEAFAGTITVRASDGLRNRVQRVLGLTVIDLPAAPDFLLWQDGDFLLWEDGSKIII